MRPTTAAVLILFLVGTALAQTAPSARLITDIEYGTAPTPVPFATPAGVTPATAPVSQHAESLKLDVRIPPGDGPFPVVILIHGGGWSSGDKAKDITPIFDPLTEAGFLWMSINYRTAPENRWPACFEDVQTAIRWAKAHAGEYHGDPKHIALLGHSAGGHLAFMAALLVKDDTRVQAVVGLAPVTDLEQDLPTRGGLSKSLQALLDRPGELTPESQKVLHELSPINHVGPGPLPPMLILQGDADKTVPFQQSRNFEAAVQKAGGNCELVIVKGAPHAVLKWDSSDASYKQKLADWLKANLK